MHNLEWAAELRCREEQTFVWFKGLLYSLMEISKSVDLRAFSVIPFAISLCFAKGDKVAYLEAPEDLGRVIVRATSVDLRRQLFECQMSASKMYMVAQICVRGHHHAGTTCVTNPARKLYLLKKSAKRPDKNFRKACSTSWDTAPLVPSIRHSVHSRYGGALNSCRAANSLVRLVEEEERWEAPDHPQGVLLQKWDVIEQNRTVTCMVIKDKANDRRKILALCRNEFRGP
ncbi:uncharacterized protein TNCV_962051 [Trichonephila clavipes]|nr:uncharacterized protein TNCV_962051 [Trichonephila clavipes]